MSWAHWIAGLASLAWLGSMGCSVEVADEERERESPPAATVAEELSSISCSEKKDTGYTKGNSFPITVVTVDGKPVEKDTANAYYVMAQAAAKAGVTLKIVSGFRTMAQQQYLYSCYVNCNCNGCNLAAKPGYSNHQSGHALDLNTSSPGVLNWLNANGAKYGFSRTVPSESWHWEWWGGGPGGGPCSCEPTHCEGSKIVSGCGKGDCAAYGANCVKDSKGVRCVSVFCPATGSKKVCLDADRLGTCKDGGITSGSCGAFGATCVEDSLGARCVSVFCPAKGKKKVCIDDSKILECNNGAPSNPGDCAAFGAYCSEVGTTSARCVSAFCVAGPKEVPKAHDVCLPDGRIAYCTKAGALTGVKKCADGSPCDSTGGVAKCPDGTNSNPGSGGAGSAGAAGSAGMPWGDPHGDPIGTAGQGVEPAPSRVASGDGDGGCSLSPRGSSRLGAAWWLALAGVLIAGRRRSTCAGIPRRAVLRRSRTPREQSL